MNKTFQQEPKTQGPDFKKLLSHPAVRLALPGDFNVDEEAEHLLALYTEVKALQDYDYAQFIHAGGSGLVVRVVDRHTGAVWALKVARRKLFKASDRLGPNTKPPFSDTEISSLSQVSHPNLVQLKEKIDNKDGVAIALVTTYVDQPQPLDAYLTHVLAQDPDPKGQKGIMPFSPVRLENACLFLIARFREIAEALAHMHDKNLFHCDVKPANILIGSDRKAILTDLGACISTKASKSLLSTRMNFTWTYAHPDLRTMEKDVRSISGGGLKASAMVEADVGLHRFDLFAFGRTIQEALAALVNEFGERCYASYAFRFLHILACLLLDGKNAPINKRSQKTDGRWFVNDVAMDYPTEIFARHKIESAEQLVLKLNRASKDASWTGHIPELDYNVAEYVNTGSGVAPYTSRVAALFKHPAIRRLRTQLQLGWVREVYPGATHSRWSHSLGVLANTAHFYNSVLSDPENPTAKLLLERADIEHALVASVIHDLGQTAFGHDLEVVNSNIFGHESFITQLLEDDTFGTERLSKAIERHWPNVDLSRVKTILKLEQQDEDNLLPVDGLAHDIINGPIDADKLDYLIRDGAACGVPYANGIDRLRFLQALTVHALEREGIATLSLAYRAKGAAAVESVLLARYQLYGSVYWHHTFRCIQAMFVQAVAPTFAKTLGTSISAQYRAAFYERVICGRPFASIKSLPSQIRNAQKGKAPPHDVAVEPTLEFAWMCVGERERRLIERIAARELFKRVFEARASDLRSVEYSSLQQEFHPAQRAKISEKLQKALMASIHRKIAERGPVESIAEAKAREHAQALGGEELPLVAIDFPIKGIPPDVSVPMEVSDPSRKYISGRTQTPVGRSVFERVRRLQIENATVRVFAETNLHELIVRYLDPSDVRNCITASMPFLKLK